MTRFTVARLTIAMSIMVLVCQLHGQQIQIGIIDFYGLSRVSANQVRQGLAFKEGDTISLGAEEPSSLKATEERLARLPGVRQARTNVVCCDEGRAIVYVGIEEQGAPPMRLRAAPVGESRLAADILEAGEKFSKAVVSAIQRGDGAEDRSQGYALAHDSTTRAIQERFIAYANRDLPQIRSVLRGSSDSSQRALAAQLLGYAREKQAVVEDLVQGMSDPVEEVRNNAMRALLVFADASPGTNKPTTRIPAQPFIELLKSPVWTDRNKASGALMVLSRERDQDLLEGLRREALTALVEMARWKSKGHALPAFMILARIAGYSDDEAHGLWERGDREVVIDSAVELP